MFDLKPRVNYTEDIKNMFGDCVSRFDEKGYSLFTIHFDNINSSTTSNKDLLILFDMAIPKQEFQKVFKINNSFTVFVATPTERDLFPDLHELSWLSFVSFHQCSSTHKNGGKKR